jgi:hypothetical protein
MSAYYFHATDGSSIEVDHCGDEAKGRIEAKRLAGEKACALMATRGPSLDWSAWEMHVYDAHGAMVATVPFVEADMPKLRRPGDLAKRMAVQNLGRLARRAKSRVR